MNARGEDILRDIFGFDRFRPGQEEIIAHLDADRHVLAVMPTGAGKSLCYQIPAIMSDRVAIVVSPLLALMDDQVAALRANGVEAACIHSGHDRATNVAEWRRVAEGRAALLYLSPERLMTPKMLTAVQALAPDLFAIDEAHCISKWGPSFRPEYEQLSQLADLFPSARIAAFTATADRATREDVAQKLFRGEGEIVVQSFDRPNLFLAVRPKADWRQQLTAFLSDKQDQAGIVYCLSRKFTEQVAEFLAGKGFNAIAYHAGLTSEQRRTGQNRFMTEAAPVMTATIAFGMGIDKPDIRFVCHLNLPASMEAYYQEIGRAGRDSTPSETLLIFGLDDVRMRRLFIAQDTAAEAHKRQELKRLDALLAYCETAGCRRVALLAYFDELAEPCGNCDNCLEPPALVEATTQAQMLFSAIYRTGQVFGAGHVIDVLRGANNERIRARRHDRLPTYGVGKDRAKTYWQGLIRQAVGGAYLTFERQYGGLQLTGKATGVLKGGDSFWIREAAAREEPKAAPKSKRAAAHAETALSAPDSELLAALKALRLDLARERKTPAYIIFHDATLIAMARDRPATTAELATINGVGPSKLETYGARFLELIRAEG